MKVGKSPEGSGGEGLSITRSVEMTDDLLDRRRLFVTH